MWLLCLNNMQAPKSEILAPVARGESREALVNFLKQEKVEGYQDGNWGKTYRKGGPLEWYNPPYGNPEKHFIRVGTLEEHKAVVLKRVEEQYNELLELLEVK